jgi:uncharacterized protein (TIGR04141 family)
MPRQPNPYFRVTVYLLHGSVSSDNLIRAKYLERPEFQTHSVQIGGRDALFVKGTVSTEQARWASLVGGWVQNPALAEGLGNRTAAAVVLMPTRAVGSGRVWAITFGMGFQMLEAGAIDPGLGRKLLIRCAEPSDIRSVTHSRLDSRAYVARTSIPGGADIQGFGASELGDFVSRLVAPAVVEGLLAGAAGARVEIRAADSFNAPLARDARQLVADLDAIEAILDREPIPELAVLEHIRPLKTSDAIVPMLQSQLDVALGNEDELKLGLAWPTEFADEAMPFSHFEITGLPQRGAVVHGHNLEDIVTPLRSLSNGDRFARLERMKVQAFSDDEDPISNALPARQWLTFETNADNHRFCLHDGRWYVVDEGLDEVLSSRLKVIFETPSPLGDLPPWPVGMDEPTYNQLLATHLGGVCLDRKLIQCAVNRKGFESCDVLTPDGTYVHVKRIGRSTGASHLFAQAGVSAQTLLDDATALQALKIAVVNAGGDPAWVPNRPEKAVLVMANKNLLNEQSLFAFSGMRLVRLADECRRQNLELFVAPVAYSS